MPEDAKQNAVPPPLVSVVIPVFNGEKYILESIDSVLAQSQKNIEIIVVDDGSTDSTPQLAQSRPKVRYIRQEHAGVGAAMNLGFSAANGTYLAGLDADDLWTKDKLDLQLTAFHERPDLEMLFGHVEQFISPELNEDERSKLDCPAGAAPGPSICTMLVRRESFQRVGMFSTTLEIGQFMEWYIRAKDLGLNIDTVPQTILHRRLHKANTTTLKKAAQTQYAQILKAAIDRRKNASNHSSD